VQPLQPIEDKPITTRDEFAEFIASSNMESCFAMLAEKNLSDQIRVVGINQTPKFMMNVFVALSLYGYAAYMAAALESNGFTVIPPAGDGPRPTRSERRRMMSGRS